MIYLRLFWEFFQTGLFAIGGGLATLPFLSKMGEKMGWFTETDLANMLAVSESTPGPIGINMATYVGNTTAGIPGGVLATLSLVLPSYVIILLISKAMMRFQENPFVKKGMEVLRPASIGMIASALLGVFLQVFLDPAALQALQWQSMVLLPQVLLFFVLLGVYHKFPKLHPVILLALGAAAGIVFQL